MQKNGKKKKKDRMTVVKGARYNCMLCAEKEERGMQGGYSIMKKIRKKNIDGCVEWQRDRSFPSNLFVFLF